MCPAWGYNDEEVWCTGSGPQAKGGDSFLAAGFHVAGAWGFQNQGTASISSCLPSLLKVSDI